MRSIICGFYHNGCHGRESYIKKRHIKNKLLIIKLDSGYRVYLTSIIIIRNIILFSILKLLIESSFFPYNKSYICYGKSHCPNILNRSKAWFRSFLSTTRDTKTPGISI